MSTLIRPDMSEVVELAQGSYPARITGGEVKQSKSEAGGMYVEWNMEACACSQSNLNGIFLPRYRTMTSGRGASMLKKLYKAATGEEMPVEFEISDLFGKEVYATVTPQKDKPEYMEIKKINAYTDQEEVIVEGASPIAEEHVPEQAAV